MPYQSGDCEKHIREKLVWTSVGRGRAALNFTVLLVDIEDGVWSALMRSE